MKTKQVCSYLNKDEYYTFHSHWSFQYSLNRQALDEGCYIFDVVILHHRYSFLNMISTKTNLSTQLAELLRRTRSLNSLDNSLQCHFPIKPTISYEDFPIMNTAK